MPMAVSETLPAAASPNASGAAGLELHPLSVPKVEPTPTTLRKNLREDEFKTKAPSHISPARLRASNYGDGAAQKSGKIKRNVAIGDG
jgi:hypothetical protein